MATNRLDVGACFEAHHQALYRYLVRLSGDADAAADAVQETFTRLLVQPPDAPIERAWLFKVGGNCVMEASRTQARRLRLLNNAPLKAPVADPPRDPQSQLEADERRRAVSEALATLSVKERTALLMREEGFSHKEIAESVGTTTGSVGTLVARALDRLAARLPLDTLSTSGNQGRNT